MKAWIDKDKVTANQSIQLGYVAFSERVWLDS
jgi:hypothetical protein